ncbi:MAG TPA: EFR1 family ferrodoxin, partial [Spirochaetota bacterium]|nr:EFR1 family ferrodoxin [Spirochaetota bacterium]
MYKKIQIHYFTGTGNSLSAVNLLAAALKKKGSSVTIINIEKQEKPSEKKADLDIFAFPVLGFSAPHIVTRYMKKLPEGDGTSKAAVLAVPAGWPGRTNRQVGKILEGKGYDVILSDYMLLPNNWSQMSAPYDEKTADKMIKDAPKSVTAYVAKLAKGTRYSFTISKPNTVWTTIIGTMFLEVGRFFMGYLFAADNNCNRCGVCVKSCPTKNIRFPKLFSAKPFWGINCENCNRCINVCPRKA